MSDNKTIKDYVPMNKPKPKPKQGHSYACPVCGIRLGSRQNLSNHMSRNH